jgi:hypothetical protein
MLTGLGAFFFFVLLPRLAICDTAIVMEHALGIG